MFDSMKEKMYYDATLRMSIIGLAPFVINDFDQNSIVYKSEGAKILPLDEDEQKMVEEFEEKTGFLVYHVMYDDVGMAGCHYAFFYVSNCEDEWKQEGQDLMNKTPIVYVKNISNPDKSEFGSIGFTVHDGALMRMY